MWANNFEEFVYFQIVEEVADEDRKIHSGYIKAYVQWLRDMHKRLLAGTPIKDIWEQLPEPQDEEVTKMNNIIELIKENERLFLDNAEELNDEELEQEDIDKYLAIQGVTEEEFSVFENQFQIKLPEDFKAVYRYKNGSGYMSLIWPQEGFYRGYRLLSLQEMIKIKSYFQHENHKMSEFPDVIDEKQLQQLDERIKPYLFCKHWFPFAEYAGSLYLMLDYNPSEKGKIGQIICYVHDPDFIYYVASDITETLKLTKTVIEDLI